MVCRSKGHKGAAHAIIFFFTYAIIMSTLLVANIPHTSIRITAICIEGAIKSIVLIRTNTRTINICISAGARIRITVTKTSGAILPSIMTQTKTGIISYFIPATGSIFTRIRITVVDISGAVLSSVTIQTKTGIISYFIFARSTIFTRIRITVVDVF